MIYNDYVLVCRKIEHTKKYIRRKAVKNAGKGWHLFNPIQKMRKTNLDKNSRGSFKSIQS